MTRNVERDGALADDYDRELQRVREHLTDRLADAEEAVGKARLAAQHEAKYDAAGDGELHNDERADLAHELEQAARALRHCARIADRYS